MLFHFEIFYNIFLKKNVCLILVPLKIHTDSITSCSGRASKTFHTFHIIMSKKDFFFLTHHKKHCTFLPAAKPSGPRTVRVVVLVGGGLVCLRQSY